MLTRLKNKIEVMLATEANIADKIGLTPNMVSGIGVALAFLSALAYTAWQTHTLYLSLAAFLLLLSGFCDALDGALARLHCEATAFGGFLDSLLDRYADAVVYTAIVLGGLSDLLWGLAALIGSLLVSYSRARVEATGIEMESVGVAERAERMIILITASIVATFWQTRLIMNATIVLLAVLSNLTVLQRASHAYKRLHNK
jgi:archaetidylinositol phosphate synthase